MGVGLRAFLVDDEPLARTRLARLLGATGRVEIVGQAGDAAEALAALARVTADVVFLDIHMPGMSGLEMARRPFAGSRQRPETDRAGSRPRPRSGAEGTPGPLTRG